MGLHLLEVEITTRCDLDCLHCYNRTNKKQDLPLAEIIKLLDFAEENNVSKFIISGGEAILHPEFKELIKIIKSKKRNLKTVIQSNGLIGQLDPELIKAFDIVHLSFEVDGSEVRKSSEQNILRSARKFIDAGIYAYLFSTIHPGNIELIDKMVDTANGHSIDIAFNLCIPGENDQLRLSRAQRVAAINKLHELYVQKRTLRFTSPFAAILKEQKTESYLGIKGGCTAGVAACSVLPNGDVVPCPFFRLKAGNIYEQDLKDIWLGSVVFSALRNRTNFQEPCGNCEYLSYCGGCRVRAYKETKNLMGFDPDCIL